jgi:murein DD-endopeptidase MepM/ murein hydrolase activator NlpD
VIFSGFSTWGYGQAVVIEHGGTLSTLYGHMSARNVSCGQSVVTGQIIGFVGSTGNSSGPHLHFEIQSNNQAVDPSGTPGIGW